MSLLRGKVKEIALQHDASRVVQAAIQFGDDEQRKELLTEICDTPGSLAEISKIQYAHFCSLKFIKYCARDKEAEKMIVKVCELGLVSIVESFTDSCPSSSHTFSWVVV